MRVDDAVLFHHALNFSNQVIRQRRMRKIRRGLDLPISGAPRQSIEDGPQIRSVAVVGPDYHGMKPTMAVQVGDRVKLGQELFSDKKSPGVKYTAPAAGVVAAINRGAKRILQSVVIDVEGSDAVEFPRYQPNELDTLQREQIRERSQQFRDLTKERNQLERQVTNVRDRDRDRDGH